MSQTCDNETVYDYYNKHEYIVICICKIKLLNWRFKFKADLRFCNLDQY